MFYKSFVRRTTVEELNRQRLAQIQALRANSAYNESKDNLEIRNREMNGINEHFDGAIEAVMDPGKHEREMKKIREDPLMAAGIRGLDRLKWNLEEGVQG